jgi:ribosomal protein S27E
MDELFVRTAEKLASTIIVLSFIGLITIPLFPWFGLEQELHNWETDEQATVVTYSYGNSRFLHAISDLPYGNDEFENLDSDISMISICFWITLFLGIIAIGGTVIYRTGRLEGYAHIMLLAGSITIIFSILILIYHALFVIHLGELEDRMEDRVIYGYNFFPLVMSIPLSIMSVFYLVRVAPFSARMLSWMTRRPRYYGKPQLQNHQQPVSQSITLKKITCPNCKNAIKVQISTFPTNVKCPICNTVFKN